MRIVFMGTPEIAVTPLRILAEKHDITGLFCQPDRPAGRKRLLTPPATKQAAVELGIPVFQPLKLRGTEVLDNIKELAPDIITVIAYGKLLPSALLELPVYGCINAHASLLPKYRGAAPIQYAIMNGETKTGITIIRMNEGLDTGDMIVSREIDILDNDDASSMVDKMSPLAAQLLLESIELIANKRTVPIAQDDSKASYAPIIKKDDGYFSFSDDAKKITDKVRGLCVWPTAFFKTRQKTVKVFSAGYSKMQGAAGEILSLNPLTVAAKDGSVELLEVMPSAGKRMEGTALVSGMRLKKGDYLQ